MGILGKVEDFFSLFAIVNREEKAIERPAFLLDCMVVILHRRGVRLMGEEIKTFLIVRQVFPEKGIRIGSVRGRSRSLVCRLLRRAGSRLCRPSGRRCRCDCTRQSLSRTACNRLLSRMAALVRLRC